MGNFKCISLLVKQMEKRKEKKDKKKIVNKVKGLRN